jgi:Nickel responsive protein SCO4226-like
MLPAEGAPSVDFDRRTTKSEATMPRYLVERTFTDGLHIPIDELGAKTCAAVVDANSQHGVTWVHSYVTADKSKTVCVYDAPSPEAIRESARLTQLPVDTITEVRVLDPYFYA